HHRAERAEVAVPGHRGDAHGGSAEAAEPAPRPWAGKPAGVAHVVDGRAEHLADRLETGAADGRELTGGQRRAPGAAAPAPRLPPPRHRGKPAIAAAVGPARSLPCGSAPLSRYRACAGRDQSPFWASHSLLRSRTFSSARAASSRVG